MFNFYINSPLDQFDIKLFFSFQSSIFDLNFINFTIFSLYLLIVLSVILFFILFKSKSIVIRGSRWFLLNEILFDTILNIVKGIIEGKYWGFYFPLVFTMFLWILIANLISIIPYSFALTAQIVFIISLSIIIWVGNTILSINKHGIKFFNLFVPVGTPLFLVPLLIIIEILSYIARGISLGLRLSSNIIAGHLLIIILSSLLFNVIFISKTTIIISTIPLLIILCIIILEFAIAIIQSYVWAILMSSYLKDSIYLH